MLRALVGSMSALALVAALAAQQPADESRASLKAGPGLDVGLWASEPMVVNPTNMTIDERGRVWVLEAVNYRRAVRNQTDLRNTGDRIVILEDTNLDGKADKSTVFDEGKHIRAPLGIAVLGDKVYISQSPDVIVYTKDAADRIVGKEVLITGFGGFDHDHGLHAVVFGPDGKLYFNHGNTGFSVTDRSGRTFQGSANGATDPMNRADAGYYQGVALRMNPDGTNLEVLGQNFRNPYELAVDSFGNVFQTDNDDDGNAWTRLNYVIEGGNFGFYGPLHRTWGNDRGGHFHNELPGVVPNVLRLGPGSPCGLLVYEGSLLPERYQGVLMHAEAGKRFLGGYPLTNDGAGFRATIDEIVFGGADTWFRPSDVAVAPDGAVFIADWYDPGVGGHNMGDPEGGRGRIFRVAPPRNTPRVPALSLGTDAGLVAAFGSPTQSVRYLAHQAIVMRGASAAPLLQRLWRGTDSILRARALWILGGLPTGGTTAVQEALADADPRFRVLGLRVLRRYGGDVLTLAKPLLRDPSPQVRREIAILLRDGNPARMTPPYLYTAPLTASAAWLDAMMELVAEYDGADRWYLEALAIAARGREDAIYARLKTSASAPSGVARSSLIWALRPRTALADLTATIGDAGKPMIEREWAIDALVNMEWGDATRAIETFVQSPAAPPALASRAFIAYARQLFSLWPDGRNSLALPMMVRRGLALPTAQVVAVDLAGRLADRQFLPDLAVLARTEGATAEARAAAIALVATTADDRYLPELRPLTTHATAAVATAAIRAVAALAPASDTGWATGILLGSAPNDVRAEALRVLAASVPGIHALAELTEQGRLPAELRSLAASLVNAATAGRGAARGRGAFGPAPPPGTPAPNTAAGAARGVAAPPDPALLLALERVGRALPRPAGRGATITSVAVLERDHRGNATDGRRVFEVESACAACHSLGGPKKIGPDLSNIGLKYGKQALLDHIVRPNDAIGFEYVVTSFQLRNGETVNGIVTETASDRVVVRVGETEERRLVPADVRSQTTSRSSMMPEGLLDVLSLQQVSDLLEFLATLDGRATR